MRYLLLIPTLFFTSTVFGQHTVNIKVVSLETQHLLDVSFRVNNKPREVPLSADGYYEIKVDPSDTITIDAGTYPIRKIPAPAEDSVIVLLDKKNHDGKGVFSIVDETAMFPGGMKEFYEYVGSSMMYPREAKKDKADGRVFVEFVISQDGSIERSSIHVIAGVHPACDKEAMRIVRESPSWIPGKINGLPVRQRLVLPFVFRYR